MGYGDEIIAAGQAQRYSDTHNRRRVRIVDTAGHARWHPIWDGNPILVRPDEQAAGFYDLLSAPHARPYIVYPFTEDTGWTFNKTFHARDHVAKIYLTAAELGMGRRLRDVLGPYVLIEPWSKHSNLRWPLTHWRALIASVPDVTFVQHLHAGNPVPLAGVESIMTTTFREACGVLAAASVYIRGESGMCHAAAALGIPQVTIWGACMDWDVLGGYDKQLGIGVSDEPCGSWRACAHCAGTMGAITVGSVMRGIAIQRACYGLR